MLLLDVYKYFQGSRIEKLYETSKYFIGTIIPNDSFLGIVWFESTATIEKNLTQITSAAIRNELIANLPNSASGGTCIGCGIDVALSVCNTIGIQNIGCYN